jgi:membrane-associated phospholipid phosphatase
MMKDQSRLVITAIILTALFLVVEFTVLNGLTQKIDADSFSLINNWGPSVPIDTVMILLSFYGREVVWTAVIMILLIKGSKYQRKTAILMIILFVILTVLGVTTKILNNRERPYDIIPSVDLLVPKEYDLSFPSGHALIVSGGATLLWLRERRRWATLALLEAILVSISRVYVGVHYPSDVIGGWLLGAIFAIIVELINQKITTFNKFIEFSAHLPLTS